MIIKRLSLANFRGFRQTEIDFQPGVNVIAGVNGVGKSSVLDAICVLLSHAIRELTPSRSKYIRLRSGDLRLGASSIDLSIEFTLRDHAYEYLIHENSKQDLLTKNEGSYQTRLTDRYQLVQGKNVSWIDDSIQPLALFFSPSRSVIKAALRSGQPISGILAVHDAALEDRRLDLVAIVRWWLNQSALGAEGDGEVYRGWTNALVTALSQFIPEFSTVTPKNADQPGLEITKGDTVLDIWQLSDGEKGMLALVLEISRRLALANPWSENPICEGAAVILIDEVDLHLHPKWQREIITRLKRTFPNCQFILTTHSPLILGEVRAEQIILLDSDGTVYRPNQSLGMDTNFVLEFIMGTSPRDEKTQATLNDIAELIESEKYEDAESLIDQARESLGTFPELVRLQTRIDRIRLLSE